MLEGGHAILADFGVAQAVAEAKDERLTRTGTSLGTPAYMSPEQASGERDLDGRSDQYALGCGLFEMLAGHPPFTGAQVEAVVRQHLTEEPPSVTQARPLVPEEVTRVINRALSKSPADRFKTTGEMAAALALTTSPVQQQRKTPLQPRWMGLAAAVVVVMVALGYFALLRGDPGMALLPGDLVAVFPFENLTGDPELDELGKITAYHVTAGLTQVDGVRVRSADAVSGALLNAGGESTEEDIAQELGAGVIVTGIITPEGESLRYHASITRVSSGEVLTALEVPGARGEEERMAGPDELRQRIMGAFALALDQDLAGLWALSTLPLMTRTRPSCGAWTFFWPGSSPTPSPTSTRPTPGTPPSWSHSTWSGGLS